MNISECVANISTNTDLKRVANEYVIDYKHLPFEEIKAAIIKTGPQYYNEENVRNTIRFFEMNPNRNFRVLFYIFIRRILLNSDDYTLDMRSTDERIIAYEQQIIDAANEYSLEDHVPNIELYRYVVEAAWENNDDISTDEQNLIDKIRVKLGISVRDYNILESQLGRFPKKDNVLHSRDEIGEMRKQLQYKGILFPVRDSNGVNYDVIPTEIADCLRKIFGIDIKEASFLVLLDEKYVRNKSYLTEILIKAGVSVPKNANMMQLKELVLKNLTARQVLGGFSANDGLDKPTLSEWCTNIGVSPYGNKPDLVGRIIEYYDGIRQFEKTDESDEREKYFTYFCELASRDYSVLRQQGVITKDLECEHYFEAGTDYIFEKIFRIKPLLMSGTEHPDGMLSFNNKLIMWDNKSKESPVSLADHIKQFERYITSSPKPVSVFMVIGPDFTDDSAKECVRFSLSSDTLILLITAAELKELATKFWAAHKNDSEALPLGIFKQSGRFNPDLVVF